MRVAAAGSAAYLDLLYSGVTAYLGRFLIVETAAADRSADGCLADHFTVHVLVGALVRIP